MKTSKKWGTTSIIQQAFKRVATKRTEDGTAYEVIGHIDHPSLVLIHGLGLCRHVFDDFIEAWSKDYQLILYDLYGHGESAPPSETASLKVYSDQIAHLLDHLNIPTASLIGFSIGGMINRRFAFDHSERLENIVILNSLHDRGDEAQLAVEERAAKVREEGPIATLDAALKRWFTADYLETGDGVAKVRAWRDLVDAESYAQAAWVLANGVRELINPEPPITKPTLVMTCENDTGSNPQMSHDIAAEIAGSQTIIVDQLQHLGLMERPDLFIEPVLEFLKSTKA